MSAGAIRIGTSGWHYRHWKGPFFPPDLPDRDRLPFYAQSFDTAEVNNSFYHLPDRDTFRAWREATPAGFCFAVKASRYITHMKKLKDAGEAVERVLDHARSLGDKLGPVLFQLPPRWRVNVERLEAFLASLPGDQRYAMEFRDESWFGQPVYDALARHGVALCVHHLDGYEAPHQVTAGFVYVRLHGPGGPYQGSYDDATLGRWAAECAAWSRQGRDVYIYFDNDERGYAAADALRLRGMTSA